MLAKEKTQYIAGPAFTLADVALGVHNAVLKPLLQAALCKCTEALPLTQILLRKLGDIRTCQCKQLPSAFCDLVARVHCHNR